MRKKGKGRLTRDQVTAGSQVILPCYPMLAVGLGLLFILQDPRRTETASFEMAKQIMTIPHWGAIFLALGFCQITAFVATNADWLRWTLIVGCGVAGFWAVLLYLSAYNDVHASYTSALWVTFTALANLASARSLARDVVWRASR